MDRVQPLLHDSIIDINMRQIMLMHKIVMHMVMQVAGVNDEIMVQMIVHI